MKNKKLNIQKQALKILRTIRNLNFNSLKEMFPNSRFNKIKKAISENRFIIIISTIIVLFIAKNFLTILNYNREIKRANKEIKIQTNINNQLKEDLEYYKTDEFILRYALEELNMRPTKESELFHGEVLEQKEEATTDKNTDTSEENTNSLDNEITNISETTENTESSSENEEQEKDKEQKENQSSELTSE